MEVLISADTLEIQESEIFGWKIVGWKKNFDQERTSFEDHGKINTYFHFLIIHLAAQRPTLCQ